MHPDHLGPLPFFRFDVLSGQKNLLHGISTRRGGVSAPPYHWLNLGFGTEEDRIVEENYRIVLKALRLDPNLLIASKQVHGNEVLVIDEWSSSSAGYTPHHMVPHVDALICSAKGPVVMVRIADCVPILLFDPAREVIAIVHAGWRGTIKGIALKVVRTLKEKVSCLPENVRAGLGPSIGPCCYTLSEERVTETKGALPGAGRFLTRRPRGFTFDLWEANRDQLLAGGLKESNIETANLCTWCNAHLFYSYRKEGGTTGRFGAFIGMKA
jgi:YfiH family protein